MPPYFRHRRRRLGDRSRRRRQRHAGTPTATGDLTATDVDNPANTFTAVSSPTASDSGYGTYTLTAAGVWTYTLDNSNGAVQALNVGETLTDTFTVTTSTAPQQVVTITINGANDAAVITGATTGAVTEAGGVQTARRHADRDRQADRHRRRQPGRRLHGRHVVATTSAWLRHLHADGGRRVDLHARQQQRAVQALNVGETLTDTFTVTTSTAPRRS